MTGAIFRYPADVCDEGVPSHTLQEWARGETGVERDGYTGFRPGAVVRFFAHETLARVVFNPRDIEGSRALLPPGTDRVISTDDWLNQANVSDLSALNEEWFGEPFEVDCVRDGTEFWRVTGTMPDPENGQGDTRDFEPATFADWVDHLEKRHCGDGEMPRWHDRPPIPEGHLRSLIWHVQSLIRRQAAVKPELPGLDPAMARGDGLAEDLRRIQRLHAEPGVTHAEFRIRALAIAVQGLEAVEAAKPEGSA
jgi:hypothetical protein